MDIVSRHDLETLLHEHGVSSKVDTLIAKLEQFFAELAERDRKATELQGVKEILDRLATAGMLTPGIPAHDLIQSYIEKRAKAPKAAKKPARARARKRHAGLGLVLALTLAACGGIPGSDDQAGDDATTGDGGVELDGAGGSDGSEIDADPAAPDATTSGDLPLNAACDPLAAECAAGLTCRVTSLAPVGGNCRAAGAAFENDPCDLGNGDGDCGHAMACLGTADTRCYVICDPADPVPRCGATDTCVQAWGATVDLGACSP